MNSFGDPNLSPGSTPASNPPRSGDIFMGSNGLRAGWRISIYIVLVVGIGVAVQGLLRHIPFFLHAVGGLQRGQLAPLGLILSEASVAIVVLASAGIMSVIEQRPFDAYGTPLRQAFGKSFWQGMLWGLAEVSLLVGLIAVVHGYSFGTLASTGSEIYKNGFLWLVGFFIVGVFEEFTFRGYLQYTLGSGIGFWWSAVILSALFGAVHLSNRGEGIVGALSVFTIAMFFCLTLRRTGNLWFAIGMHCSFDWGETFLYSVPNSGTTTAGSLSHSLLHGARWITGGTVGPEGSLFCFLTMILLFLVFDRMYPAKRK
ncbi:MAG: type II CAAX endopeptidase family protein [Candidatus Acidiferrales bacterium]